MRAAQIDSRLEAIAGPPLAWIEGAGSRRLAISPHGYKIIYVVADWLTLDDTYTAVASLGDDPAATQGKMSFRASPGRRISIRVDPANGSVNRTITPPEIRRPGTTVGWAEIEEGTGRARMGGIGITEMTTTIAEPGDGFLYPALTGQRNTTADPIATLAYADCPPHDAGTRARICAWLANRYLGSPPPA